MASRWYGLKLSLTYSSKHNGIFHPSASELKSSPTAFNIKSLNGRLLIVRIATYSRAMVDKLHICIFIRIFTSKKTINKTCKPYKLIIQVIGQGLKLPKYKITHK